MPSGPGLPVALHRLATCGPVTGSPFRAATSYNARHYAVPRRRVAGPASRRDGHVTTRGSRVQYSKSCVQLRALAAEDSPRPRPGGLRKARRGSSRRLLKNSRDDRSEGIGWAFATRRAPLGSAGTHEEGCDDARRIEEKRATGRRRPIRDAPQQAIACRGEAG